MSNKHHNFHSYINNPMSKDSIMLIYDVNNIKFEKCELYNDFIQSLLLLIFNTYMGDEVTSSEEQYAHFKWCWDKNRDNFIKEGISFQGNLIYEYFLEYTYEVFYSINKDSTIYSFEENLNLWGSIFDYDRVKTNLEMDTFIDAYNMFENSLFLRD